MNVSDDFMLNIACFACCLWSSVFCMSGVVGHDVEYDDVILVECYLSDFVVCLSKFVCDVCFNVVCCCLLFVCGLIIVVCRLFLSDVVDMLLNDCWSYPP